MWNLVQCAVQGRGHLKANVPCQDKTYAYQADGVSAIALADGAGSVSMSHYGAEHITQYICKEIAANFDEYFNRSDGIRVKMELVEKIQHQLYELAGELQCEFRDLSSTLLLTAVKDDRYLLLHIGDGVIGYSRNQELKVASYPENGEFANTTVFTTSKDALHTMKLMKGRLDGIDGFVLISDGTEAALYHKREKKLAPALSRVMQTAAVIQPEAMNAQLEDSFLNIIRNVTKDDCSIVMMVETSGRFPGYRNLTRKEKMDLLQINLSGTAKDTQIKRYDEILEYLLQKQSLKAVSDKVHGKKSKRKTKLRVEKLLNLNLVEECEDIYHTIVIMEYP